MKQIKIDTIRHYARMYEFAISMPEDKDKDEMVMFDKISENWYGHSCPYCQVYYRFVHICDTKCPLKTDTRCCDGLWYVMDESTTWKEFSIRLLDVLAYICEKG